MHLLREMSRGWFTGGKDRIYGINRMGDRTGKVGRLGSAMNATSCECHEFGGGCRALLMSAASCASWRSTRSRLSQQRQSGPMREVLRTRGFRFFFSREGHEPRHIHVERAEKYAKFWLEPIELAESRGFRSQELAALRRMLRNIVMSLSTLGTGTTVNKRTGDAVEVSFTRDALVVTLSDGRTVSVPLEWFPRLLRATATQRRNWRLIGGGIGIHWEDVDEDISVRSQLAS